MATLETVVDVGHIRPHPRLHTTAAITAAAAVIAAAAVTAAAGGRITAARPACWSERERGNDCIRHLALGGVIGVVGHGEGVAALQHLQRCCFTCNRNNKATVF